MRWKKIKFKSKMKIKMNFKKLKVQKSKKINNFLLVINNKILSKFKIILQKSWLISNNSHDFVQDIFGRLRKWLMEIQMSFGDSWMIFGIGISKRLVPMKFKLSNVWLLDQCHLNQIKYLDLCLWIILLKKQ